MGDHGPGVALYWSDPLRTREQTTCIFYKLGWPRRRPIATESVRSHQFICAEGSSICVQECFFCPRDLCDGSENVSLRKASSRGSFLVWCLHLIFPYGALARGR